MKKALLILLTIVPVAALATQTGQESTNQGGSDNTLQKPAISKQAQDSPIDDPIDPLPISKKKCLAVDKNGFCSKWDSN